MMHLGWKIVFGASWIPAALLYYVFIGSIFYAAGDSPANWVGGIGFIILLIPTILVAGLQVLLGYLAFRG